MTIGLRAQLMLARHGFHYTHSLGQNFIFDDGVIDQIASAAEVSTGRNVVEIGSGAGVLTAALLQKGARVLAVEIDRSLEPVLSEMLEGMPSVKILFEDVLKVDLGREAREFFADERFSVVANLPYYITADIVLMLLKSGLPLDSITVTVQKEAADRITAKPGEKQYSALAATVQYFGEPTVIMEIPRSAFTPMPHVDSCLLRIDLYDEKPFAATDEKVFLRLITACFAMRRKTLVNNLMSAFSMERGFAEGLLTEAGLPVQVRGEVLTQEQRVRLSDLFSTDRNRPHWQ